MPDIAMFDRYTDRARRALVIAQDEARNLGHARIGAGHLLIGLIGEDGGVAAVALKSLGNPAEMLLDARRVVTRSGLRQDKIPAGPLPCTSMLAGVLDRAAVEATLLGNNYIATEHLLLALIHDSAGTGNDPLVAIGVNPDEARAKVMELLRGYEAGERPEPGTAPPAGDRLSSALEEIRERQKAAAEFPLAEFAAFHGPDTKTIGGWIAASALDVPRLVAALDAVLAEHRQHVTSNFPAPGICSHERLPWPCPTVRAITRALLGGKKTDG